MAFHVWEFVRLVHVVASALWAGAAFLGAVVVGPAMKAAGLGGKPFMEAIERRGGFPRVMMPLALTSILAGLLLYWGRGYTAGPVSSVPATLLTIGALAGIVTVVLGMAFGLPLQRRMKALAASFGPGGPTPEQGVEMARLGARVGRIGTVGTVLIGVALVLMVGRNVVA